MIKFYNRVTKAYEVEKVAGEKYLKWNYSSPIGMSLLEVIIKKKLFSKIYGSYCDSNRSKKKVFEFVKDFNIDKNESKKTIDEFESFNDFFIRELKSGARPIEKKEESLISTGDGRILAFESINLDDLVQVKGITYSLYELIENKEIASKYRNGTCLILRLCPTDYHRFHFIDSGICEETKKIKGHYYSVNPIALEKVKKLYCQNKREWSVFHSDHFGEVLYVEVGATCVGTIAQSYFPGKRVTKGEEKGYFKFGGSTVILFFENGTVKIDEDIVEQTKKGYETKVFMGEKIGEKV